jgi:hypothetical protein
MREILIACNDHQQQSITLLFEDDIARCLYLYMEAQLLVTRSLSGSLRASQ